MNNCEAAYLAGIIDGEGSITLTRMQANEFRRPCISISSTDKELLEYIQTLTCGIIVNKKNYNPLKHKNSFTLIIKKKDNVLMVLNHIYPYLRIKQKKERCLWILQRYEMVTPRNGKYSKSLLEQKLLFEKSFFNI